MMGLPYGEEIMIVGRTMWTQSTSVTDGQTDRQNYDDYKDRATHSVARYKGQCNVYGLAFVFCKLLFSYETAMICSLSFENLPMTIAAMAPGPIPEMCKNIS